MYFSHLLNCDAFQSLKNKLSNPHSLSPTSWIVITINASHTLITVWLPPSLTLSSCFFYPSLTLSLLNLFSGMVILTCRSVGASASIWIRTSAGVPLTRSVHGFSWFFFIWAYQCFLVDFSAFWYFKCFLVQCSASVQPSDLPFLFSDLASITTAWLEAQVQV